MKTVFTIALATWFLTGVLFSQESDKAAQDPRLTQILAAIELMQSSAEAKLQKRREQYIEDLKKLERSLLSEGDLDHVLEVKRERNAWEAGKSTPPITPKDESVFIELRKLRYYFDQEFEKLTKELEASGNRQKKKIVAAFSEDEKSAMFSGTANRVYRL